jgi:Domain of unknown function (DUF4430)
MRTLLPILLATFVLSGCGGSSATDATIWVTRDRGAELVLEQSVPSGLTAIQALERVADVDTSYGGRFVQSIDGVAGDASREMSWFYFVNGIEADKGGAEYRVRPGDVVWWDYRSWKGASMRQPVVVGAFPEPFIHGYGGHVRPAVVRYATKHAEAVALGLANAIGAVSVERFGVAVPEDANLLRIVDEPQTFTAALRSAEGSAGSPVVFAISYPDARRLLTDLELARRRYEGLP